MNATYETAFNAYVDTLTRELVPPVDSPLGWGTDLACVEDLTPDMSSVDPYTPRAIAEAQARRLQTGRGQLVGDADYGTDLRGMLSQGYTDAELRIVDTQITNELLKDDRVSSVEVTVMFTSNREALRVAVVSTPVDSSESFAATFYVTDRYTLIEELL